MGRPTMEGYECSGKFYRNFKDDQYLCKYHSAQRLVRFPAHLRCIANLKEPSPSIKDCCWSAFCKASSEAQLCIPMGASAILDQLSRINLAYCYLPGSSTKCAERAHRAKPQARSSEAAAGRLGSPMHETISCTTVLSQRPSSNDALFGLSIQWGLCMFIVRETSPFLDLVQIIRSICCFS